VLARVIANVKDGGPRPLPPGEFLASTVAVPDKPDYPDTLLAQFVEQRLHLEEPTDREEADDYFRAVGSLFTQIRDKAVLGQITVWGRENCPVGQKHTPRTPIPADHWKIAQIDLEDYLSDPERYVGCTAPIKSAFNRTYFSDLYLSARQIRGAW
jgi:hypothetical protein